MERGDTENRAFKPLSEAENEWGSKLMRARRADRETQDGVLGYGRSVDGMDALAVFVAPNTDLDDKATYPDEIGDFRIVYEKLPLPEEH